MKYPSIYDAKEKIIEIGKRMYAKGLVVANDGNISCRLSPDTILTTPTGVSKGYMDPDMMVKMSLEGQVLAAGESKPSSEVKMHLRVYQENPEVIAVVHAHPPIATSFAIAGIGLDQPILTEAIMSLGSVPVAKYATPGTHEVPDSIAPFCTDFNAVLLANHGALTWGDSLQQAYFRMESVEYYAKILMYTGNIIGKSNKLSCDQIIPLLATREKLGIKGGGTPACSYDATNDRDVMPATGSIGGCMCGGEKTKTVYGGSANSSDSVNMPMLDEVDIGKIAEQVMREIFAKIKQD